MVLKLYMKRLRYDCCLASAKLLMLIALKYALLAWWDDP